MRAAIWSPLPPARGAIAENTYEVLRELARDLAVTAVVRDDATAARTIAPAGVEVIAKSAYLPADVDRDVYVMGNEVELHGYVYAQALRRPGILVLHPAALTGFYAGLCGGFGSSIFLEEARFNVAGLRKLPTIETAFGDEVDAITLLMTKRLVDASLQTIVHSEWARAAILERSPSAEVHCIPLAATILEDRDRRSGEALFGAFGSISNDTQLDETLRAFEELHRDFPRTRLVIAGRNENTDLVDELHAYITEHQLFDAVTLMTDPEPDEIDDLLLACDASIALRWPTAGETIAELMRSLGAGRLVIASDVPQHQQFDERYCWRVPTQSGPLRRALVSAMAKVAADPEAAREAGMLGRMVVRNDASPAVIADRYRGLIVRSMTATAHREADASGQYEPDAPAVNAIASWASTTGLTESARRAVFGLLDARVQVAIEDYDFGAPQEAHRFPTRFRQLVSGRPYGIDLCFLNVNEFQVLPDLYLRRPDRKTYVIGYWYWELPAVSANIVRQIERVDEIWVASAFVRDAFSPYTSVPITIMPCVIEPEPDPDLTRSDFGVAEDACVFLFNFDANSTLARKNPIGVIDAFRSAFSRPERGRDVVLVVKSMNLDRLPEAQGWIREQVAAVGGVLIEDDLPSRTWSSLMALCDVYVSLHRSEGFGLGMAEAMYFGRPVIATAYSGNLEFTTVRNSCPVGYRIGQVSETDLRFNPGAEAVYVPGQLWAEPDLDQASSWMRLLYEQPEARQRIGSVAREDIRRRYSVHAAGVALRARLEEIGVLRN